MVGSSTGTGGIRTDSTASGIKAELTISSGSLTVTGGITYNAGASGDPFVFSMSGGTIDVNTGSTGTSGETFNTTDVVGSSFTMSAGTITIQNKTSGSYSDFSVCGTNGSVSSTGGTVQFGNSSSSNTQTFNFTPFASITLPNFKVSSSASSIALKPFTSGNIKLMSLYIDAGESFDVSHNANASDNRTLTLTSTYDGTYAYYNNNSTNTSDYVYRNSTVIFSGTGAFKPNTYQAYKPEFWNLTCAASGYTTTIYAGL